MQIKILNRAIKLLKVGGRVVYSTCSFNPAEDEAVLAQILRTHKGIVKLVDVSDQFPLLKRNPGRSSWKVMDEIGIYTSFDELKQKNPRANYLPSIFPPTPEEAKDFHLERS